MGIAKCIFYSKAGKPKVIGTVSFDDTYNIKTATTDLTEREFTSEEGDLYTIRKAALTAVDSDSLFDCYPDARLNLIPLLHGDDKKVNVLTGPEKNGVVIFGNDYLITFDKDNNLTNKKRLYKNIIPIHFGGAEDKDKEVVGTMHSHLPDTGDLITATDIGTLMLYEKFTKWQKHQVVSARYLNIWDCKSDELTVIPLPGR